MTTESDLSTAIGAMQHEAETPPDTKDGHTRGLLITVGIELAKSKLAAMLAGHPDPFPAVPPMSHN